MAEETGLLADGFARYNARVVRARMSGLIQVCRWLVERHLLYQLLTFLRFPPLDFSPFWGRSVEEEFWVVT